MNKVRLSPAAERDLVEIWFQIAIDSGAVAADQWTDRIEKRCYQLTAFPEMGPVRPDIAPLARALVISRWLVLYRIVAGGVRVNRIIDAARDIGALDLFDDE